VTFPNKLVFTVRSF